MFLVLAALTIGVGVWVGKASARPAPVFFIALDWSDSKTTDCSQDVGSILNRYIETAEKEGAGVLYVVKMGTADTENEPQVLSFDAIPVPEKSGPWKTKEAKAEAAVKQATLKERVVGLCAGLGVTKRASPIRRMVTRAVEAMRAEHCGDGRLCFLNVVTDLSEAGVDKLEDMKARPIDNTGIAIRLCGYSEVRNDRTGLNDHGKTFDQMELQKELWAEGFTSQVEFVPFCRVGGVATASIQSEASHAE